METFRTLLAKAALGNGISSTAYDTAWVAKLGQLDDELSDLALNWLCERQLPDGSWGAEFPFCYEDRLLSTLAAMISLTSNKHRRRRAAQVEKGLLALKNLTSGAFEGPQLDIKDATVGFELIAPTLMAEAARLGLAICHEESILGELVGVREQKLRKLGGSKINKHITAAFSVELAGQDGVGMLDVDNLQETNGSVKYSPSASAYFALHVKPGDKRALAYISSIIQAGDGGAPAFYQAEIFEIVWSLWNLSRTDIDFPILRSFVRTYPILTMSNNIGSVVEVWGGQEIPPWKIVTPQVWPTMFCRSLDGRRISEPYYNSKTPIGSVPTFTKSAPRYRRTSTCSVR